MPKLETLIMTIAVAGSIVILVSVWGGFMRYNVCETERAGLHAAVEQWWAPGIDHRASLLLDCLDLNE